MSRLGLRWVKFNLVGAIGVGVQLGSLALLKSWMNAMLAVGIAVEIAVLHNFVWHERFTWKDRPGGGRERLLRLLRFHLANGAFSILANIGLTWLLTNRFHIRRLLLANGIAIAICSVLNFALGEWFVFRRN